MIFVFAVQFPHGVLEQVLPKIFRIWVVEVIFM